MRLLRTRFSSFLIPAFLSAVFSAVFSLGCQTAPKPTDRSPQSSSARIAERSSELPPELRAALERRVRKLQRPISVFHYARRGPSQFNVRGSKKKGGYSSPLKLDEGEAGTYLRAVSRAFETIPETEDVVGGGLYAAVDPIQSDDYAKSPWVLIEVLVPAGTVYLDLRPEDRVLPLSDELADRYAIPVRFPGILTKEVDGRKYAFFGDMLRMPELREPMIRAIHELKVDAIAYPWRPSTIEICRKRANETKIAFNFIRPEFFSSTDRYRVYTANLEENASAEKKAAYSRILDLIEATRFEFHANSRLRDAIHWRPGAHIGVALTLPWVKALGRTSILSGLLQDPSQLDLLHEKMVKYSMHGLDPGVTFPIVNEKLVPEGRPPAYIHDSLDALRETNPTEYARRKKLVEEAIFGCSESHREENAIPSLE